MVRELGSERRETVWSLSAVKKEKNQDLALVREDWDRVIYGYAIVLELHVAMLNYEQIIAEYHIKREASLKFFS